MAQSFKVIFRTTDLLLEIWIIMIANLDLYMLIFIYGEVLRISKQGSSQIYLLQIILIFMLENSVVIPLAEDVMELLNTIVCFAQRILISFWIMVLVLIDALFLHLTLQVILWLLTMLDFLVINAQSNVLRDNFQTIIKEIYIMDLYLVNLVF